MKRFFILIIILSLVGVGYAQSINSNVPSAKPQKSKPDEKKISKTLTPDEFHVIDEYARKTPKQYEKNIPVLAEYLTKPAKTDMQKVRAIFTWVAVHINYDDAGYNSNKYSDTFADSVLRSKIAVCEGYANLMQALCESAGLDAVTIDGYAKGYGYNPGDKFTEANHTWNAVKVNAQWHLFDATWGGGYGTNNRGKLVSTAEFEPYWFDVNPHAFIFTHLPEQSKWQLTGGSLTLGNYEKLPYLDESFFKFGFDPDKSYIEAVSGRITTFVETFPMGFPFKIIQLPYSKVLHRKQEIKFVIQSDYAEDIALIDKSNWYYFSKEKNIFTLLHKPTGDELTICVKINWFDKDYVPVMKYSVTK